MTQHHELERSRRDVLDLSLRNPLLNFRPSKRRAPDVVDELSRERLRILVGGDRILYFLAPPDQQHECSAGTSPTAATSSAARRWS